MKTTEINERAAAKAMDAIVGEQKRMAIVELYLMLDGAERVGYEEGFQAGFAGGGEFEETAYHAGFGAGYDAGNSAATSTEQPDDVIYLPAYEGDSGDEVSDGAVYAAYANRLADEAGEPPYTIGELVDAVSASVPPCTHTQFEGVTGYTIPPMQVQRAPGETQFRRYE